MNRRKLLKAAAAGAAAAALPKAALAAHRPQAVDLTIRRIEWSTDGGLAWGAGEIKERAPVLLRAVVANTGEMTAPGNRPLKVDFYVNGELVSVSDHHRSGLVAGQEVVLEASTGPMGDPTWDDAEVGILRIRAVVDPDDLFPSEHDENNVREVETEAVTVSDNLSVVGQITGAVIGGVPGLIGGGFVGGMIGRAIDTYRGELTSASMIGYQNPPGNGGYFPQRADRVALDFGTTPALIEAAVKRFRNAPKTPHAWWKHSNPKIYGTDGAIDELGNSRTFAKASLVLHPESQWVGNNNKDEFRDLALFADGFFDPHGAPTNGGRATDDGCGEGPFYQDVCRAAGLTPTGTIYGQMRHICISAGFHGCTVREWRSGVIKMNHASELGLGLNSRPSPTNGPSSRPHGLRAMVHYATAGSQLTGIAFGAWVDFLTRSAKLHGAQAPSTFAAWVAILKAFIQHGKRNASILRGQVETEMRRDGWSSEALTDVSNFIDDFFNGTGMTKDIMEWFAEILLEDIENGTGGPRRPVSQGVFDAINRNTTGVQRDRYAEVIEAYAAWRAGDVEQGVFMSQVGTVTYR